MPALRADARGITAAHVITTLPAQPTSLAPSCAKLTQATRAVQTTNQQPKPEAHIRHQRPEENLSRCNRHADAITARSAPSRGHREPWTLITPVKVRTGHNVHARVDRARRMLKRNAPECSPWPAYHEHIHSGVWQPPRQRRIHVLREPRDPDGLSPDRRGPGRISPRPPPALRRVSRLCDTRRVTVFEIDGLHKRPCKSIRFSPLPQRRPRRTKEALVRKRLMCERRTSSDKRPPTPQARANRQGKRDAKHRKGQQDPGDGERSAPATKHAGRIVVVPRSAIVSGQGTLRIDRWSPLPRTCDTRSAAPRPRPAFCRARSH